MTWPEDREPQSEFTPKPGEQSTPESTGNGSRFGLRPPPEPPLCAPDPGLCEADPPLADPPLFEAWTRPEPPSATRIPHLGHVALLLAVALMGWACAAIVVDGALYFHLFFRALGVSTFAQALKDIRYLLASMGLFYLFALGISLVLFPRLWHKSFFAGLQWRGRTAIAQWLNLVFAVFACIGLAIANLILMPGPENTPIEKLFQSTQAAWLMFAFGVTFAPFFEELAFRGFLLPALCTAIDWAGEKIRHLSPPGLDLNGHPRWSLPAMIWGSLLTSFPFAALHLEQTAYAAGPFLLLICVSLVLCWIRLRTRSLAASVVVHSCYNFILFALMAAGTGGFHHFEKM